MGQKSSTIDNNNLDEGASSRYSRRRTAQEDSSSRPSRVRFSEKLKIVLIPSRTEFNAFRLTETLWWSNQEFLETKGGAESELLGALSLEETISSMEALQLLYQPRCANGHDILHVLIVSEDMKFRSSVYSMIKKAHKKNAAHNRLLIQQACSAEELDEKLDICVDFNAVFFDKTIVLRTPSVNLQEKVRDRHKCACIVIVCQRANCAEAFMDSVDRGWSLDKVSGFEHEWKEIIELSMLRAKQPHIKGKYDNTYGIENCSSINSLPSLGSDVDDDEFSNIPQTVETMIENTDLACVALCRLPPYTISASNTCWTELYGYSTEASEGKDISFIFGKKTDSIKVASLKSAAEKGTLISTFLITYHSEGNEFISYIRGSPMTESLYICTFERVEMHL